MIYGNARPIPEFCQCSSPDVCCGWCARCGICGKTHYWTELEVAYQLGTQHQEMGVPGGTKGDYRWGSVYPNDQLAESA